MMQLYLIELGVSVVFVLILHRLRNRYEPDWTWLTVVIGTIISTAPAMLAARQLPAPDWQTYESRVITGFVVSGSIVIPWQIGLAVWRWKERRRYQLVAKEPADGDPATPLA